MCFLNTLGLVLLFTVVAASTGAAHSLKELEGRLGERERYFQTIDKDAPDFELRDAAGRKVQLADFRDKVVVLHFVYTSCPDVCPLHAERIAEIQEMVNQTPMKDQVQFISVTTDPRNDAPEVLRIYGPAHGLESTNWKFLTVGPGQPEDTTRSLAERFGHKFTKTDEGYQIHGVVTHVIGREGRWRANFHGLKFQPTYLVLFVNALVNDHHGPAERSRSLWDKVRELF